MKMGEKARGKETRGSSDSCSMPTKYSESHFALQLFTVPLLAVKSFSSRPTGSLLKSSRPPQGGRLHKTSPLFLIPSGPVVSYLLSLASVSSGKPEAYEVGRRG